MTKDTLDESGFLFQFVFLHPFIIKGHEDRNSSGAGTWRQELGEGHAVHWLIPDCLRLLSQPRTTSFRGVV